MTHDPRISHAARETVAGEYGDPTDIDAWPYDLAMTAGKMLKGIEIIDATIALDRHLGRSTTAAQLALGDLREARDALILLSKMSPLARWTLLHPPRMDPLDYGLDGKPCYDCGNPDCPATGFTSPEDRQMHYRRWGLT